MELIIFKKLDFLEIISKAYNKQSTLIQENLLNFGKNSENLWYISHDLLLTYPPPVQCDKSPTLTHSQGIQYLTTKASPSQFLLPSQFHIQETKLQVSSAKESGAHPFLLATNIGQRLYARPSRCLRILGPQSSSSQFTHSMKVPDQEKLTRGSYFYLVPC